MGHLLLRVMEGNPCLEGFAFGGPVGDGSQRGEGQSKLVDKMTIHVRARPHVETLEHQHVECVVRTALPMIGRTRRPPGVSFWSSASCMSSANTVQGLDVPHAITVTTFSLISGFSPQIGEVWRLGPPLRKCQPGKIPQQPQIKTVHP